LFSLFFIYAVQEQQKMIDSLFSIINPPHSNQRMGNTGNNNDSISKQDIKLRLPDGATLGCKPSEQSVLKEG